jgi:hypothetical protein
MSLKTWLMTGLLAFGAKNASAQDTPAPQPDRDSPLNTVTAAKITPNNSIPTAKPWEKAQPDPIQRISNDFSQNFFDVLAEWTKNAPDIRYRRVGKRVLVNQGDYTKQDKYFHRKFDQEHATCMAFFKDFIAQNPDLQEKIDNYELLDIPKYLQKIRYVPKASCASGQTMMWFRALMKTIQNCQTPEEAKTAVHMANIMSGVVNPNSAKELKDGLSHFCDNLCTGKTLAEAFQSTDGVVFAFNPRKGGSGFHAYGSVYDVIGSVNRGKFCNESLAPDIKGTRVFDLTAAGNKAMEAYQNNDVLAYTTQIKIANYNSNHANYSYAQARGRGSKGVRKL